eukprot:CAMPEP_0197650528 /NCGR_PEP_ID=MMETSP1338-20131121/31004_1 /TAXON_ID=43686 ORGANISM="Pelagodinium beii, Strain RCC1491" /NCGR_SAMPLE_ID=MMETSP1338 /ASSEMBLY_ACC=CAM_ASM_000754 /LENGTH=128 /DNA_ID=CAMNT_0043224957 /DNA_START=57 /DNA_END=446 /DNA_ORIENTATION=-
MRIVGLIKEETFFLLDEETREEIAHADAQQKDRIHMQALMGYVGVETADDLELLVTVFRQGQKGENLEVDPADVLDLLDEFLQQKRLQQSSGSAKQKTSSSALEAIGGSCLRRIQALRQQRVATAICA